MKRKEEETTEEKEVGDVYEHEGEWRSF